MSSAVPGDLALTNAVDDVISQTFEPGFIRSANFMQFKFDAGSYALAGREKMLNRDVLKIEYYPKTLFDDNAKKPPCEQRTKPCDKGDELERDALASIRGGVGRDYLAYAEKRERLVVSDSPVTTRARLLADWWEQARDDLTGNIMLARMPMIAMTTNSSIRLNAALRFGSTQPYLASAPYGASQNLMLYGFGTTR